MQVDWISYFNHKKSRIQPIQLVIYVIQLCCSISLLLPSSDKIILIIIQLDRLLFAKMSSPIISKSKKRRQNKLKKLTQPQENEVLVGKPLKDVQYPSHMHEVNFFSMDNFQACSEDEPTNLIYHQVIMENQHLFAGKRNINCLYSIFAARAGASKVYCLINGKSEREVQNVFMVRQLIQENQLQELVEVCLWKDFNAKVDIIVGQPMGYCLHFDGLLDKFIQARDQFLSKKGIMLPNILSFKCGVVHDEYFSDYKINFWDDVYGIPMTSMKKWISHEPLIRTVDPNLIVSKVTNLLTFNLETITYDEIIKIDKVVEISLLGPCKANGTVYWCEAFFSHCLEMKEINASPWSELTKYSQVTLYWPTVLQFNGGKLRIRLKGQKHLNEGYSLITTELDGRIYQYSLS